MKEVLYTVGSLVKAVAIIIGIIMIIRELVQMSKNKGSVKKALKYLFVTVGVVLLITVIEFAVAYSDQ